MRTHSIAWYWITPALAGFVTGTALQLQQAQLNAGWLYALGAAGALVCAGLAALARQRLVRDAATFACAVAFAFSACGMRALLFDDQRLASEFEGRDLVVTGVVAAMPQRSDTGLRFRFDLESAVLEGADVRLPPRVYLGWYSNETGASTPDLQAGERWRATVRLKAPHGHVNPHGFDYELWLWEQGIQATGYVRAGVRDAAAPHRIAQTGLHPVEWARQSVRDAVLRQVQDRKIAGILAALIVGDQNAIERADWDVFRATGVAHLMSISGLHITMFGWAAALLVGALWRRSERLCLAFPAAHAALIGGVVLAGAYALFSGWGVPAQRTIWMLATVGALRLSGRRWPWPQVWLLACAVVVAIDPWAMLQAGFWLSFVAVGVLFAADPGVREEPSGRMQRLLARLRAAWHEQWVVTLALTPLALLLFGQVSVVGLPANALAIPWVTLVVTPLALAGVAFSSLWSLAALAVQALQVWLEWLASLPLATIAMPAAPLWAGVTGVIGGLLLAMRLPWHMRLLGVPLLLPVLMWQAPRPPAGEFELLAADVGQGNAVIVRTAGHTLVYDAGPRYGPESDAGHRVLVPLLRAFDERVDMLMLSHRDTDHTGGAAALLAMQPQATLVSSLSDGHELQSLRPSTRCVAGQQWHWDGVSFELLHPAGADYGSAAKSNALSCVLRISNGRRTALLAGDVEAPQESRLVTGGAALAADVLLAPHHGSKTSSSAEFLDAVHPGFAMVQAGYRNRFGHPAPVVLERYRERGVAVIDSPHCGAAGWQSWQAAELTCQRELQPKYWQHRLP